MGLSCHLDACVSIPSVLYHPIQGSGFPKIKGAEVREKNIYIWDMWSTRRSPGIFCVPFTPSGYVCFSYFFFFVFSLFYFFYGSFFSGMSRFCNSWLNFKSTPPQIADVDPFCQLSNCVVGPKQTQQAADPQFPNKLKWCFVRGMAFRSSFTHKKMPIIPQECSPQGTYPKYPNFRWGNVVNYWRVGGGSKKISHPPSPESALREVFPPSRSFLNNAVILPSRVLLPIPILPVCQWYPSHVARHWLGPHSVFVCSLWNRYCVSCNGCVIVCRIICVSCNVSLCCVVQFAPFYFEAHRQTSNNDDRISLFVN